MHRLLEGSWGNTPTGNVLDFNSVKSPLLGFCVILKYLTDSCKTVETNMDPHLVIPLKCKLIDASLSYEYFCFRSMKL